jgi:hypothetical protein
MYKTEYVFQLTFEDGKKVESDLRSLLSEHIQPNDLRSANIDLEWGCLEFKDGMIDIEPQTLYNYAVNEE